MATITTPAAADTVTALAEANANTQVMDFPFENGVTLVRQRD